MLRWVFPQVLVIWLITLLFMEHKEFIQDYIPLMLPGILFGTLSFLGLIPIAFGIAIEQLIRTKCYKQWLKKIFSIPNLLSLFFLGSVLVLYFYGNVVSEKPDNISFHFVNYSGYFGKYLIFCIIMVLAYAECILTKNIKNILYYLVIAILVILPLFKMGIANDLVMRCSIPALFLLMLFIISYLQEYAKEEWHRIQNENDAKYSISTFVLVILLFIGSIHPMQELFDSIITDNFMTLGEEMSFGTMENFANRSMDAGDDVKFNYFSYDIDTNLFYNYVGRKKDVR